MSPVTVAVGTLQRADVEGRFLLFVRQTFIDELISARQAETYQRRVGRQWAFIDLPWKARPYRIIKQQYVDVQWSTSIKADESRETRQKHIFD